ncbi:hypothetical protein HAX54_036549 [Datura stramonium]|uniref:Uncharacterized protein n=1 Tax=Datura stramonium TaxID=4076 RepID=A0ABS8SGD0_DATST|nr:hypothetical protein [Datura stramonium]
MPRLGLWALTHRSNPEGSSKKVNTIRTSGITLSTRDFNGTSLDNKGADKTTLELIDSGLLHAAPTHPSRSQREAADMDNTFRCITTSPKNKYGKRKWLPSTEEYYISKKCFKSLMKLRNRTREVAATVGKTPRPSKHFQ